MVEATGISKARIRAGIRDLAEQAANPTTIPARAQRARRPGAGRRSLTDKSREAVVALIQGTTTKAGLKVRAKLDQRSDAVGKSVSDFAMKQLRVRTHRFRRGLELHGMRQRKGSVISIGRLSASAEGHFPLSLLSC